MTKTCLECGEKIIGRSDKKFCNDNCRNTYNNKANSDAKNLIRSTNNKLRKNWRILETLNPDQKTKTPKSKLTNLGFDFDYFTNMYITKSGNTYYFIYNQGYLALDDDFYALVKREY